MMMQRHARAGGDIVAELRAFRIDAGYSLGVGQLHLLAATEIERLRTALNAARADISWRSRVAAEQQMRADHAEAALSEPTGWLPIATAPRGIDVRLRATHEEDGAFEQVYATGWLTPHGWVIEDRRKLRGAIATHWCALPAPPEVTPAPDGWADGSNVR